MTVEELNAELSQFGQDLQDLSPTLTDIGERITNDMVRKAPVDTGALRNSIRTFVTYNSLEIEMLSYGAYQNYGVNSGKGNKPANAVQFGVSPRPSSEPFYAFKGGLLGIRPKNFFNMDILQDTVEQSLLEIEI